MQGSKTKQFEQIGNAVPPPLAAAVLACLIDEPVSCKAVIRDWERVDGRTYEAVEVREHL